jgi:hypothetical protein
MQPVIIRLLLQTSERPLMNEAMESSSFGWGDGARGERPGEAQGCARAKDREALARHEQERSDRDRRPSGRDTHRPPRHEALSFAARATGRLGSHACGLPFVLEQT